MKGIILAGGNGKRLYPITIPTIKQLLPVYDKPMIYYPLATLMLAGVREILIISTEKDLDKFIQLFGNGSNIGLKFHYKVQKEPKGIAESLIIAEDFIGNDNVWLILGDNIFFGSRLGQILVDVGKEKEGATIFGYEVSDPERYGVIEFNKEWKVLSIKEKPKKTNSKYAVTGLYFYDKKAVEIAKKLKPSNRGELEITDVNNEYLKEGTLKVKLIGRGFAWLDTGTYDSLLEASNFVSIIEKRQGLKISCIEEIAYNLGYINKKQLEKLAKPLKNTSYGQYLINIVNKDS